jgi:transposase InsO family protein
MYMPYTINPYLPRLRMEAANRVRYQKWSIRQTARYYGVQPSTVFRWLDKATMTNRNIIPTLSSRPQHHPFELKDEVVEAILDYRKRYRRCALVSHYLLLRDGYQVSLSSVKRVLKRHHVSRFSRWKKWHQYPPRPLPEKPGMLVQIDTVLDGPPSERLCVYALMDICSRWAFAWPIEHISSRASVRFLTAAQDSAPFQFRTIQSDHGSEFSKWFTKIAEHKGFSHRHSRVRRPTDNGHIERFIRTLQEECLARINRNLASWRKNIPEYINYYNTERPHLGLNMQSPLQVLRRY